MIKNALITVLMLFTLLGFGQQADSLIKVKNNLYMITGIGGNVAFLTTNEGVVVVDAGTIKSDASIIEKHIKSVTNKPIKYLVLTHYHFDHAFGACGFSDNPIIVAHKNISKNIENSGKFMLDNWVIKGLESEIAGLKHEIDSLKKVGATGWDTIEQNFTAKSERLKNAKQTTIVYPNITFEQEMTLILDTDTIKLVHPGNTHTDCNIAVEFTNNNVLATGDLFFNHCMPYIDFNANCDTENWIEQSKKFARNNYDFVIPGHGNIAKSNDLMKQAQYITDLRAEIKSLIDKNTSFEEILQNVKMTNYANYDFQEALYSEIDAVYKEFTER